MPAVRLLPANTHTNAHALRRAVPNANRTGNADGHGYRESDSDRRIRSYGDRYADSDRWGHEHSYADLDAGADVDAGADLDAAAHLDAGWTANIHADDTTDGHEHTD